MAPHRRPSYCNCSVQADHRLAFEAEAAWSSSSRLSEAGIPKKLNDRTLFSNRILGF